MAAKGIAMSPSSACVPVRVCVFWSSSGGVIISTSSYLRTSSFVYDDIMLYYNRPYDRLTLP